jgi:hypothetical protein
MWITLALSLYDASSGIRARLTWLMDRSDKTYPSDIDQGIQAIRDTEKDLQKA